MDGTLSPACVLIAPSVCMVDENKLANYGTDMLLPFYRNSSGSIPSSNYQLHQNQESLPHV